MNQEVIAFIFARGGSKGLPRKNLLPLAGKPLIVHSIEVALGISRVKKVVVSTDDPEIAAVACKAGAEVPFLRPVELAGDNTPEWLAWQHAIHALRKQGEVVDHFLSLPPTSPLRTSKDVNCCLDSFFDTSADMVITVCEAEHNPYFNMVRKESDGSVRLAMEGSFHRRQDAPKFYDITTVAYVAKADFILNSTHIFDGKVRAVQIPRERALDIDTELDFFIGANLINKSPLVGEAQLLREEK